MQPRMFPCLVLFLSLTAGMASCGEDPPVDDERPADGSVEAWGDCTWLGQVTYELCREPFICSDYGFCVPPCESIDHCAAWDFVDLCVSQSNWKAVNVCVISCDGDGKCPDTGGVPLQCSPIGECH